MRFPRVVACDRVFIDLAAGEVHAVVGENGAGKSTLMHALVGVVRPESGTMAVEGNEVPPGQPRRSRQAGIAMVFQRFRLVPALTVAQNVILGLEREPFLLPPRSLIARVREVAERFDIDVDPAARVADLPEGKRQQVEILRIFYRGARILILDEPTSVLTPRESDALMGWIRKRAASGVGVFLISHKMPEVLAVSDRITVMRQGKVVAAGLNPAECTRERLAALMVGEEAAAGLCGPDEAKTVLQAQDEVLALRGVTLAPRGGREFLQDVGLTVRASEIVGVAGVSGNGQGLLCQVAAGLAVPDCGRVEIAGRDRTGASAREFAEAGVRYAPEDRDHLAVAPELAIADNAVLREYRTPACGRVFLSPAGLASKAADVIAASEARVPGPGAPASVLSGGNLQKLVMERESRGPVSLLIASQPTQGLDVAAAARVRGRLVALAKRGAAVLLVSSDLDEVLELSDRVVVLYRGRLTVAHHRRPFDRGRVGSLMMGMEP